MRNCSDKEIYFWQSDFIYFTWHLNLFKKIGIVNKNLF